ncbi:Mobile element protein [Corynebacterium glutamicum]|uniref:DDE-type integrase/transposase/recombinase n=1 Tax=Corynebacterium glutamicum TaxID=1718 RepID=UPI00097F14CE|nr:Mobile element protein [Corynebacterium glutamicum]
MAPKRTITGSHNREYSNKLWVADITYISTSQGWVYAAFVLDAFSREIVGWQITNHMRASLVSCAVSSL